MNCGPRPRYNFDSRSVQECADKLAFAINTNILQLVYVYEIIILIGCHVYSVGIIIGPSVVTRTTEGILLNNFIREISIFIIKSNSWLMLYCDGILV